jgi:hypothetical protein
MHYNKQFPVTRPPKWQVLRSVNDVDKIEFVDGLAEVEVPIGLVARLPLKNHERRDSPRLRSLMASIRAKGYSSLEPIVVRVGRAGRWVVVDGGHRLTAAQLVAREYWANFFSPKVGRLSFLVYHTPLSYSRVRAQSDNAEAGDAQARTPPVEPPHISRNSDSRETGPDACARPFSTNRSR